MQSQMHLPTLSKTNKILIIVLVASFLIGSILFKAMGINIHGLFGLSGYSLAKGFVFQLITYPLVSRGLLEVVFGALIFWFIGSELENLWGRKKYWGFLLATMIGGGLIYAAISMIFFSGSFLFSVPLSGVTGITGAMCMCFGILFPERLMYLFFFPVKAKWFVLFLIGMNLYQGIFSPSGILAWGQLGAYLSAFLWMMAMSNPWMKSVLKRSPKRKKSASHLRIVKGDHDDKDDITYH